jgi:hypothetical protein
MLELERGGEGQCGREGGPEEREGSGGRIGAGFGAEERGSERGGGGSGGRHGRAGRARCGVLGGGGLWLRFLSAERVPR